MYTYRSISRTPITEATASTEEKNRIMKKILESKIAKMGELKSYVENAISVFNKTLGLVASATRKLVPESLYDTLIRMLDVFVKLENLKDIKSSLSLDYAHYRRALGGGQTFDRTHTFLVTEKEAIFKNLRTEVKNIAGHEEVLLEILNQLLFNVENSVFVTPDEVFSYLRVLPYLMYLIDGDPSNPKSLNIFAKNSKLPMSKIQNLIRQHPVVPLYAEIPITLFYILCRIPHFDRLAMGERWGETPDQATLKFYDIATHWEGIKHSFNEVVISFTTIMNKIHRQPFSKTLNEENISFASEVYKAVKGGLLQLSQWTKTFLQILAWKYSHPVIKKKVDALNATMDKPGHQYECALKDNFSLGEYNVIVDIISMIKSLASLLLKAESKLAPILRFHIHHVIQQLVQGDLLPLMHRLGKRKKKTALENIQLIRDLAADGESAHTNDYESYSRTKGRFFPDHQPRVVGLGCYELQFLRTYIRNLYDENSFLRQKSGFGGRVELENDDVRLFKTFHCDSFYFSYILNFSQTLREVSDLGDLWYRELFLEMTKHEQFPIEMSFPWILTEHLISSKAIEIPIIEKVLYAMDIYNDALHRSLYIMKQQFLVDEIEFEAKAALDKLVFLISDEMYAYHKNFVASHTIDKAYKIKNEELRRQGVFEVCSLEVPCRRYHIPIGQRHIQLLGRSIDLNYLIGQNLQNQLYRDIESVIQRFESSDYAFIVELDSLLTVIRNTHALLSEFVELVSFDFILSEVNESYGPVSFSNRISLHMTRTLTSDLFPNSLYNKDTERFVQSPTTLRPVEYDKAPKNLAPNMHYGSVCNKAYDQLGKMTRKFFGKSHLHSMLAVLKPTDLPLLIDQCLISIEQHFREKQSSIEALRSGVQKCKVPQFLYKLGACYGYLDKQIGVKAEDDQLIAEVLQLFRTIGNTLCFFLCLSDVMDMRKSFSFAGTNYLFGIEPHSFLSTAVELHSTPLGATLLKWKENTHTSPHFVENFMDISQHLLNTRTGSGEKSQALICHALHRIKDIIEKNEAFPDMVSAAFCDDITDVENCSGFHRFWSIVKFLLCNPIKTDFTNHLGHGITAAGCAIIHILGQRHTFELLDFSQHLVNVHQHDLNAGSLPSKTNVDKVEDSMQESAEAFVIKAKEQFQVQCHYFALFQNICPNVEPCKRSFPDIVATPEATDKNRFSIPTRS